MSDIFSGKKVLVNYEKQVSDAVLFVATDPNFPDAIWAQQSTSNKVVPRAESESYKAKIEGKIYISDLATIRDRLVVGNTNTWTSTLPQPQYGFNAFNDGSLFVSGRIHTPAFQVSQKTFSNVLYSDTNFTVNSSAGRIKIRNVRPYDSISRKSFTVQNNLVKYYEGNENEISSVFLNVISYTVSRTSPIATITNIQNGSFTFEVANFTNSGDDEGELILNFFIV